MLAFFRERMGPLLWVTLFLLVGGFVLTTDSGTTFNLGFSNTPFSVDGEKIPLREVQEFASRCFDFYIRPDRDALKKQIDKELAKDVPDQKKIESLQEEFKKERNQLQYTAAHLAWEKECIKDGIEVSRSQAIAHLRKNPYFAYRYLKGDFFAFKEGKKLSPQGMRHLEGYRHQRNINLHQLMYESCFSVPVNVAYSHNASTAGFHYGTFRITADLISIPLSSLSNYKVSLDETDFNQFFEAHRDLVPNEETLGYKNPATLDFNCWLAVSEDFTSEVAVNITSLRKHYEKNKYLKWVLPPKKNSDEISDIEKQTPQFLPFSTVKEAVKKDYRLQQAALLAQKYLEKILENLKQGKLEVEDLQKDDKLSFYEFEGIVETSIDKCLDGADFSGLFDKKENTLSEKVENCDQGAYFYKILKKQEASTPELESIYDQVLQDYYHEKNRAILWNGMKAFKKSWDQEHDLEKSIDTLTQDLVSATSADFSRSNILIEDLGLLKKNSEPPIHAIYPYLVQDLFAATYRGQQFSSGVESQRKPDNVVLMIARDYFFDDVTEEGKRFPDLYDDSMRQIRKRIFENYQNAFLNFIYSVKVKGIQ
jgi:hypothetical protein